MCLLFSELLVHWDDPEGWNGEGGGRRVQDGEHMYTCGGFILGLLELDTTERLHFHFSLSCIGEGNGNPLQCSCLENPRDGKPGGLPSMGHTELYTTEVT